MKRKSKKKKKEIKNKDLDQAVRLVVRQRDRVCQYPISEKHPQHSTQLQVSHFYGRGALSVRWDLDNLDLICARAHWFLETKKNAEYSDWKLAQLGPQKYEELRKRYYAYKQFSQADKANLLAELKKMIKDEHLL